MSWQQVTFIVLWSISGVITLIKHGEPKGNFNFGYWLLAFALEFWLLYSAGFFG